MRRWIFALWAVVTGPFVAHAITLPEVWNGIRSFADSPQDRETLQAVVDDYVEEVVREAGTAIWIFTDGSMDEENA